MSPVGSLLQWPLPCTQPTRAPPSHPLGGTLFVRLCTPLAQTVNKGAWCRRLNASTRGARPPKNTLTSPVFTGGVFLPSVKFRRAVTIRRNSGQSTTGDGDGADLHPMQGTSVRIIRSMLKVPPRSGACPAAKSSRHRSRLQRKNKRPRWRSGKPRASGVAAWQLPRAPG